MGVNNFDKGTLYLGDMKIGEVQDIEFTTDFIADVENKISCFNEEYECEIELIDENKIANKLEVNFDRAYRKGHK